MRKFLLGFITAVVVVFLAEFLWVRLGLVDPRADIPVGAFEQTMAMPALDASVDRRATEEKNPVEPTDANLVAGMKIYQTNCAICHGDVNHPHGSLADALYPRAPQFMEEAPDMPENQNYYIIQHGVRLSGMPAWKQSLSEQEMWQTTAFLSHMNNLPPEISAQWKAAAGGSSGANSSGRPDHSDPPSMGKNMHMPKMP